MEEWVLSTSQWLSSGDCGSVQKILTYAHIVFFGLPPPGNQRSKVSENLPLGKSTRSCEWEVLRSESIYLSLLLIQFRTVEQTLLSDIRRSLAPGKFSSMKVKYFNQRLAWEFPSGTLHAGSNSLWAKSFVYYASQVWDFGLLIRIVRWFINVNTTSEGNPLWFRLIYFLA